LFAIATAGGANSITVTPVPSSCTRRDCVELYKVVLSVKISGCARKAGTLDWDVKRVVKVAQDHAINLTRLAAKGGEG